ncbi:MAG: hypothetical protein QXZ25_04640 [Candidatus Bathyarchaeia archaeon]
MDNQTVHKIIKSKAIGRPESFKKENFKDMATERRGKFVFSRVGITWRRLIGPNHRSK